jgi:hypothetical protein
VAIFRGAHKPVPQVWYAATEYTVDMRSISWNQRSAFLAKYNKTKHDVVDHQIILQRRYVHNADEFVCVKTDIVAYFPTLVHHSPNSQDRAAECISELL